MAKNVSPKNLMDGQKSFCLYTTPRCGSTVILEYIAACLELSYGHVNRSEFLNFKKQQQVIQLQHQKSISVHQMHFEYLQQSTELLAFKMFPFDCSDQQKEWVFENFNTIGLFRENLWEQFLSLVLARESGVWFENADFNSEIRKESIVVSKEHLDLFEEQTQHFRLDIKKFNIGTVLKYEDFDERNPKLFLDKIPISLPNIPAEFSIPDKKPKVSKEALISNLEQARQWFKDLGLDLEKDSF